MSKCNGRVLCFDSETCGFLDNVHTKRDVHIIYVIDAETREPFIFFDDFEDRVNAVHLGSWETEKSGTVEDGVRFLSEAKSIIIQNGTGFDFHIFEKVYNKLFNTKFNYFESTGCDRFPYRVLDTYTMSCTLNPERKVPHEAYALGKGNVGAHSIEAHGIRMGRFKPEHEDWSHLSEDMINRVSEDTEIGLDFYFYLMKEWREQRARPHPVTGMCIMQAYYTELRVAMTMARQAIRGFAFDVGYAGDLLRELDPKLAEVEAYFRPRMPKRIKKSKISYSAKQLACIRENLKAPESFIKETTGERGSASSTTWNITNKWTKKGSKVAAGVTKRYPSMRGYYEDLIDPIVVGAFTPVTFEDIPLGNRDIVKQIIHKYGWRGVEFNDKENEHAEEHGEYPFPWSGKINEKSIERWKETCNPPKWALGISDWYILSSRRTQVLNEKDVAYFEKTKAESEDGVGRWPRQANKKYECRGLLPKTICFDEEGKGMTAMQYYEKHGMWPDSGHWRIPAVAFHAATNTFRMRHRNVVNIPSRGLYGKEMRKLFIAKKGHLVLGCDGAGLELRMLAHFMNDPEYTETVLNGDIHSYNQLMAGLPTRDMAKTFIYAFLYGSGIPNLAAVCGVTTDEMGRCIASFKRKLPRLAALLEGVEKAGEAYGYMLALDGRWGRIRASGGKLKLHTCLNVLLQMTGSILMKVGHIQAEDEAVRIGAIETVGDFPIVAHQHDEGQMEVKESECEQIIYSISREAWESEEKAEYKDEKARYYSAPVIINEEGDKLTVKRIYHPIGHCYAHGIKQAGVLLGIRIETSGEYMLGSSWLETH